MIDAILIVFACCCGVVSAWALIPIVVVAWRVCPAPSGLEFKAREMQDRYASLHERADELKSQWRTFLPGETVEVRDSVRHYLGRVDQDIEAGDVAYYEPQADEWKVMTCSVESCFPWPESGSGDQPGNSGSGA